MEWILLFESETLEACPGLSKKPGRLGWLPTKLCASAVCVQIGGKSKAKDAVLGLVNREKGIKQSHGKRVAFVGFMFVPGFLSLKK